MTKLYVPLEKDERKALVNLASREKRDARLQAALFIRQGLERAGLLQPSDLQLAESTNEKK